MFRRRKTGEGINYAGEKKIEEEKYCILLVRWKLERENKMKKSKLTIKEYFITNLWSYIYIYIFIMEIKKIIASLNSEKLTVSSQEENVLRAHGKTLFF